MTLDVKRLMDAGRKFYADKNLEEEKDKIGTFRVGTSGVLITVAGQPTACGHCPRKALARSLGIQQAVEENRQWMFGGGHANETVVLAELQAGLGDKFVIKTEENCPVSFTCAGGTVVSGRPDLVVFDKATDKPVYGIECKAVCSVWTAKEVGFEKQPKSDHTIQAGIYSLLMGVPWTIIYTSRVDYTVPEWAARRKWFEGADDKVERNAKGDVTKVLPFETYFHIAWDNGQLFWARDNETEFKPTHITEDSIMAYYDMVEASITGKQIPARPAPISMLDLSSTFDSCSPKYCSWSGQCDAVDNGDYGFDRWLKEIAKSSR